MGRSRLDGISEKGEFDFVRRVRGFPSFADLDSSSFRSSFPPLQTLPRTSYFFHRQHLHNSLDEDHLLDSRASAVRSFSSSSHPVSVSSLSTLTSLLIASHRTSLLQPSFSGSLTHQAIIPPSSSSLFNASFVAARPGIYNVAGWHLTVETGQETTESEDGEEEDQWKGRKLFEQVPREEKRVKVLEEVETTRRIGGGGEGLVAVTA